MNKDKFFLISLIASLLVSSLSSITVKIVHQIYNLPAWVNKSTVDVFLALVMSCMSMAGIIYSLRLWQTKEWRDYSFFYQIRSLSAFVLILLLFLISLLVLYIEVKNILVLF
jgi:hypothetical protein